MGTLRPRPWASQDGFSYRFEWGVDGLDAVVDGCAAVVVVDVLRFSTAASLVTELGGRVELSDDPDDLRLGSADLRRTVLADPLTPVKLWSPNGRSVAVAARGRGVAVFAGCFRNASATATAAAQVANGSPIAVIAAGERWDGDRLRPATEDLLGAGAVLARLDPGGALTEPCCSPAARAARAAFLDAEPLLLDLTSATASGRELWERGDGVDVREAARLDVAPMPTEFTAAPSEVDQ